MLQDIGYESTPVGVSHEVMVLTLGVSRDIVSELEGTEGTPLVVKRRNPVDPVLKWTQ